MALLPRAVAAAFLSATSTATSSSSSSPLHRFVNRKSLAVLFVATSSSARAFSFAGSRRGRNLVLPRSGKNNLGGLASSGLVFRSNGSRGTSLSVIANTRGGSSSSSSSSFSRNIRSFGTTTAEADSGGDASKIIEVEMKSAASKTTAGERLAAMRAKMEECGVDVYLVPSDDPHLSEYVPAAYMRRGYLTDFHGSAGTAIVTADKAYLWTDSRYFNEASLRLDSDHWDLMKQGQPDVPSITKFLSDLAAAHHAKRSKSLRVGMDAYVHSASFASDLKEAFAAAARDAAAPNGDDAARAIAEIDTLDGKPNVVDSVWEGRPPLPKNPFRVQPMKYAGMSVADKVAKIRSDMKEKKATLAVFGALDDVAYLFNVRCTGDVETCPVGIAYAAVSHDAVTLYCADEKVAPPVVSEHLKASDVVVKPYESIVGDIKSHLESAASNKVWIDSTRSNHALCRVVPARSLIDAQNSVVPMKAVKNGAEMAGMRLAHVVDGAAMAEFMAWLEDKVVVEGRTVSEVEVDEVLTACRARRPGFLEPSFPTIAGVGANGAIVHYRAAEGSDLLKHLDGKTPILIDSGGQYEYGTTDVTRTWYFGEDVGAEFRDVYTRVLKGHIGLDTLIFPENTPGFVLDILARKSLWEVGKDYGHGTGHGVGAALNVHEGPHGIGPRWTNREVLKRGMITSNEPGYYEDGNFGIRIENLLEIVGFGDEDEKDAAGAKDRDGPPAAKRRKRPLGTGGKKFLKFANLTLIPIQKNLIDLDLVTDAELDWLDVYHEEVLEKVAPLLEEGSPAMKWLVKSCEKIERKR